VARGIGGDDGPSLWMFVAVVVVWGAFRSWMTETKNDVKGALGIGSNTAGPLQAESSSDIKTMEEQVKSWPVTWSALPRAKTYYQNIADKIFKEICAVNTDEEMILSLCRPLSKNELMAVAKCFGVRELTVIGLTTASFHIFGGLERAFDGIFKGNERAEIHKIWAVTKLW
jgi:hypothetical protein